MLIIGTKFITWGSEGVTQPTQCSRCGNVAPFNRKKGKQFISLFFVIPVIPLGGVKEIAQCPNCGARYESAGI